MKTIIHLLFLFACLYLISLSGCYSTYESVNIKVDTIPPSVSYTDPTKVFLTNDDILVFENGFTRQYNSLLGQYQRYDFKGNQLGHGYEVLLDSVVAITQYVETTSGGLYFASALNVFFGVPLTALAIYCLVCPKCCFGSCPTVYVPSENTYILEAELFSKSISRQLEENDLDMLNYKIPSDGSVKLKVTNEALETHYINKFNLIAVTHPKATKVCQTNNDQIILINELIPAEKIISSSGKDISEIIKSDDGIYFRSDEDKILELRDKPIKDFIEITSFTRPGKEKIKMLIKYRNTLLTTTLLYDVVIGSQGINALEWTKKMNNDKFYAMQFKSVYDLFSGISIECKINNNWTEIGKYQDAGPINWKYSVAEIPVSSDGKIQIKLEFIPDNFMIDYIAFDTTQSKNNLTVEKLNPVLITNFRNESGNEIVNVINTDDDQYLITNPGDSYLFSFKIDKSPDKETSLFIESKGYYNEWIRGNWINNQDVNYTFNLFDIKGTFNQLVTSWIENKDLLEEEFFKAKIPLKEAK